MTGAALIRATVFAGLALALNGCATPLEQCIAGANAEVRFLQEELTERRVNIARGYAIQRNTRTEMMPEFCYSPSPACGSCAWRRCRPCTNRAAPSMLPTSRSASRSLNAPLRAKSSAPRRQRASATRNFPKASLAGPQKGPLPPLGLRLIHPRVFRAR